MLGLPFDNDYAWVVKFNQEGIMVQIRSYVDSVMVKRAIEETEK
jgi:uncharacterized protein